jgi:lysophospholipase L1-like esterase
VSVRRLRARARVVPLAALVVLVGALAGCYFETSAPPTGPEVLVIGDSNVSKGGPDLVEILGPAYTTTVDGVPGAGAQTWYPGVTWPQRLANLLAAHPAVAIVVQLGTNDAGSAESAAAFAEHLDAILAVVPAETLVLWNNVRLPAVEGWTAENVATVNGALASATARWPNLRIEDQAGYFDGHPEWAQPDSLHFTPEGYRELASWNLANLQAALAP